MRTMEKMCVREVAQDLDILQESFVKSRVMCLRLR